MGGNGLKRSGHSTGGSMQNLTLLGHRLLNSEACKWWAMKKLGTMLGKLQPRFVGKADLDRQALTPTSC